MSVATKESYVDYRSSEYDTKMREYIKELEKNLKTDPDAERKARSFLPRTGVANKNGHIKKKIVSWE